MMVLSVCCTRDGAGAQGSYAASRGHALIAYFYGLIGEGNLSDIMIWFLRNGLRVAARKLDRTHGPFQLSIEITFKSICLRTARL